MIKEISFEIKDKKHNYMEKLQCLDLKKMSNIANNINLDVNYIFGGYNLSVFEEKESDRLILIMQ